jgi:hypothetical protein
LREDAGFPREEIHSPRLEIGSLREKIGVFREELLSKRSGIDFPKVKAESLREKNEG